MRRPRISRDRLTVVAAVAALATAVLVGVGTVAYAVFTASTRAEAGAEAAELRPLVTDQVTTVFDNPDGLYPGHHATVTMVVRNPNGVPVDVVAVQFADKDVSRATPDTDAARSYCRDRLAGVDFPPFTGDPGLRVPAGGTIRLTLRGAVSLHTSADNRCQRMAFSTTWKVTGANA